MAKEVQRMRERLVNLGIAVAEIAHDGESTVERKWDGEEKISDYLSIPESPSKRTATATADAAAPAYEDSCMPNSSSTPPEFASYGAKRASSFCLQDRIAEGIENLCSSAVSKKNCNILSADESFSLEGAATSIMGTPRTPSERHKLRNLDGRKIDLWQIKAREEPEGGNRQNVEEEEVEKSQPLSSKQEQKQQGSGVQSPLICRPIKIPSKAELGRVLANRGERSVAERGLFSREQSPCNKAAKSPETELSRRRKEHEIATNQKDTLYSLAAVSPTFGRAIKSRGKIKRNLEEGNALEDQRHSNTKPKVDASSPSSCTFPTFEDSLSSAKPFEISNLERRESSHEHDDTNFQGESQLIRTQRLFGRCKSVNVNEIIGTFCAFSY